MKQKYQACQLISFEAPNTTKAAYANTVDPDETAPDELSHPDL